MESYINSLLRELEIYKDKLSDYNIKTIFIGGGTPSSIDAKYIEKILNYIYNIFNVDDHVEVSIEVNPGTIDKYKVKKYKSSGINRISLGVQSLNDDILKSIGRIHNIQDFYNSLKILRNEGFDNVNVDLMFSLPGQTMEDIEYTLSEIIRLKIEHISLYSLIIEDNTPLGKLYNRGLIESIDDKLDRLMYHSAIEILRDAGYKHYEISNFAKENKESQHNLAYWKVEPYLGVGVSSHSNMFAKRFYNYSDIDTYNKFLDRNNLPIEGEEIIDRETLIGEYMIMGLRLIDGIDIDEYYKRFSEDIYQRYGKVISKHVDGGLLNIRDSKIALTSKGLDLANIVEVDFYNI